jgi:hypothetical protein
MPAWIHDRARHILRGNPEMDESEAFAIATQQAHALKKSPKGYGTPEGRVAARRKYRTPADDVKTADPTPKEAMWMAFQDELEKTGAFPDLRTALSAIPRVFSSGMRTVGSTVRSFIPKLRLGGMSLPARPLPVPSAVRTTAPLRIAGGSTPAPSAPSSVGRSGQSPLPAPPPVTASRP